MNRVCVIDIPGLSRELLQFVPPDSALGKWIAMQRVVGMTPTWPAVTCSMQATITTGKPPAEHGIIANGMPTFQSAEDQELVDASNFASYRRDVSFWEQSNQFLDVPRFWLVGNRINTIKTALLCMQHSMPGFTGTQSPAADIVLTPKPDHGTDGKIVSLCWSEPPSLVPELFSKLGPFPLMNYWGPMAGIKASQWIAQAAVRIWETQQPRLQFTYIPHLDYDLQRFGPESAQAHDAVRDVVAAIEPLVDAVTSGGGKLVVLSEYAIEPVDRVIQPNNLFREAGLLVTRNCEDGAIIDYDRSVVFAMVDHQIAHVYGRHASAVTVARRLLEASGLETLDRSKTLPHRRAGDLLVQAPKGAWLDYRWWTDPADAPAFARKVDIHRKPGYDPLELFWDHQSNGMTQNAALIHGSHGRVTEGEAIVIAEAITAVDTIPAKAIAPLILELLNEG